MYNDYYLLKKIEDVQGDVSYATALDNFTYKGEVVEKPHDFADHNCPQVGDRVQFLKGAGEDVGDGLKAVKYEDIIRKI